MNQNLVTKKNRKVRQLRAFYPDVRIKILYQRDYLHLAAKYGLDDGTGRPPRNPTRCPGPPLVVRLTDRAATPDRDRSGSAHENGGTVGTGIATGRDLPAP